VQPVTHPPCLDIADAISHCGFEPKFVDRPIKILALDGGGVRGIISAKTLQWIEDHTHRPLCQTFDLIAGTSTGGIAALALTVPSSPESLDPKFSARDVVTLYKNESSTVFPQPYWWSKPWRMFKDVRRAEYTPDGLTQVVHKYCADTLLKDSLTEVIIPSMEITESKPWYFQRSISRIDPNFASLRMVDVIRNATAAPTYFPPNPMTIGGKHYAFIDAGVGINVPSVTAYSEAKKMFRQPDDNYIVVSLGTGVCKEKIPYDGDASWGLSKWAPKIVSLFIQSQAQAANRQMEAFLPETGARQSYFRFQTAIDEKNTELDNPSPENLQELEEAADAMIEEQIDQLGKLCEKLTQDLDL
jgi:uncharacterized protein